MPNTNPYLDMLQGDTEGDLRLSMMNAVDKQPDDEAKIQKLAADYNLPVEAVRLDRPTVERKAKLGSIDYATLAKEMPATAAVLKNPHHAAIAHDDLDNLTGIETALNYSKNMLKAGAAGIFGATEGLSGVAEAGVDALRKYVTGPIADAGILPADIGGPLSQIVQGIRQSQRDWRQYLTPQGQGNIESGIYSGVQSLTQNMLTLPFAIASENPSLLLNTLTAITGGQSYTKARDKGLSFERSALFAAADATVERAMEMPSVSILFKDVAAGSSFFKTLGRQLLTEIPAEEITTAFQDLNEWGVLNEGQTFGDYLAARPDAAIQTLIATAVGTGGMVSLAKGAEALTNREAAKAQLALNRQQQIEQLNTLAAASKVLRRNPDVIKSMAEMVLQDSDAQSVYIDANTLAQSGLADQIAALVPDVARQMPDAMDSGGEIKIAMADYLTHIAPNTYAQSLVEHVRMDGEEFTPAQATTYLNEHAQEFAAEMERAIVDQGRQQAAQASFNNVKDMVLEQLNQTGRFTGNVNDHYASLVSAFYATMGDRLGMSAETLFERNYPSIVAARTNSPQQLTQPVVIPDDAYNSTMIDITDADGNQSQIAANELLSHTESKINAYRELIACIEGA